MAEFSSKSPRPKTQVQDDSIMGTNNSSIVSKRSVERLYFSDENFFRPFVKKPQRRAPLINRGYWLRMKAIDYVVRQFLEEQSGKPKIVINLGCGYDPLPFQSLARYPKACKSVKFVDIDYKALLVKKRDIIKNTVELSGVLANLTCPEDDFLLLQSDRYLQLGCDLCELPNLSLALGSTIDLEGSLVLCIAEVSITYMDVEAADALIRWVGGLPDGEQHPARVIFNVDDIWVARFCLLEQIIPNGPEHPFAATMMAHFAKLRTPLNAVRKYQTILDQEKRFRQAGWSNVNAQNLWELWGTSDFLTSDQRTTLDNIEPFDEWEEFALFGCHYFLLVARNVAPRRQQLHEESGLIGAMPLGTDVLSPSSENLVANREPSLAKSALMWSTECPKSGSRRRFAASLPIRGSDRQKDLIGNFGGMGPDSRLSSYDVYVSCPTEEPFHHQAPLESPSSRMCHTCTDLGNLGVLLVGGRTSPDNALVDCWLFHKWTNTWERVDDLPAPRYRHSTIAIGDSVLVAGGKSDSRTIHNQFLVWNRRRGWLACVLKVLRGGESDDRYPAKFGAVFAIDDKALKDGHIRGILAGGLSQDGLLLEDLWLWTLDGLGLNEPSITLEIPVTSSNLQPLARFGATVTPHQGRIFVLGGIGRNCMLGEEEIISVTLGDGALTTIQTYTICLEASSPKPLIIGSSAVSLGSSIVILGGGAVCFSFGAFWNSACFSLDFIESTRGGPGCRIRKSQGGCNTWRYFETFEITTEPILYNRMPDGSTTMLVSENITIPRKRIASPADFAAVVNTAQPTILEGLELGSCTELWTSEYLKEKVGVDRKVIVHQASMDDMDFNSRNFSYVTKSFGEFIDAIDAGEKLYLRALSSEKPTELPTNIEQDFPTIAADFQLPVELGTVIENAHSSPLRISGPVNMWLHYDVMANVLCQIRGSKRLMLFPPSDVQYFDFKPGSSSSSTNVFSTPEDPKLAFAHPHEAVLLPRDVLFLPALWFHAAMPIGRTGISVNVFFRNLASGYASGRDVYGNRDLQAYEKGRQDVAKIVRSFSKLPSDIQGFYIHRLAEELAQMGSYRES